MNDLNNCFSMIVGSWADEVENEEEKENNIYRSNRYQKRTIKKYERKHINEKCNDIILQKEEELTRVVIGYMEEDYINPLRGSVPLERIQNIIHSFYLELYDIVIKNKYKGKWRDYIKAHQDVFHLFCIYQNNNKKLRMRKKYKFGIK